MNNTEPDEKTQELNQRIAELEDVRKANLNLLDDLEAERETIITAKAKDDAIFESIGEGLVAVDNNGKITVINKAAVDMFGWKMEDLIGRVITELPLEDEAGNPVPFNKRPTTIALATGEIARVEYFFIKKDRTKLPIAITATPIKLDGQTIGLIEIIRDRTRENELDRVKSEFISIASHQLRTPLTGIQWVVERFTKKEQLTPKGKEYLNDIHMSARRLTEMVDLLLSLSRIEGGRIKTTPEPLEVVGLVKSFLDEFAPLVDKKELKISFDEHPADLVVTTDRGALRNIVQSLVSNAIEYTPVGGSIKVAVQKEGNNFLITIQDTGIGIPHEEQLHIFEKFMRASNAKLYKTDGTGIGLYIAKQATSQLGGKIWFESAEQKGTTFHVEIPIVLEPIPLPPPAIL